MQPEYQLWEDRIREDYRHVSARYRADDEIAHAPGFAGHCRFQVVKLMTLGCTRRSKSLNAIRSTSVCDPALKAISS